MSGDGLSPCETACLVVPNSGGRSDGFGPRLPAVEGTRLQWLLSSMTRLLSCDEAADTDLKNIGNGAGSCFPREERTSGIDLRLVKNVATATGGQGDDVDDAVAAPFTPLDTSLVVSFGTCCITSCTVIARNIFV